MNDLYKINETMQMIADQPFGIFTSKVIKGINDIADARPNAFTIDAAMDIFSLGYFYGTDAERDRLHKRMISKEICDNSPCTLQDDYRAATIDMLNDIDDLKCLNKIYIHTSVHYEHLKREGQHE